MYITLTIKAPDEESAVRRFRTLDITAMNTFNRIGNTGLRVLTSQERIEMLRDFFVGAENMTVPKLTAEDFAKGKEKLYCSPDYFDFKKDYFMFNDKYAKVLYIREYPSTATSDILTGLLGTGIEIMVSSNTETYDSAEARKLVQRQITAVDTDMAKREVKAAQHGNFSSQMPQRIKNQRDAMVSVFDKITVKDQKLFMVNTQILIKADCFEQLNDVLRLSKAPSSVPAVSRVKWLGSRNTECRTVCPWAIRENLIISAQCLPSPLRYLCPSMFVRYRCHTLHTMV